MELRADNQFWGEYEHTIDDKGRVVFPQEMRAALGEEFVVARGPDKAILVFTRPIWDEIERKVNGHILHRQAGFLQRMLGGRTFVKLDPQFRLAIPKLLRDYAGINSSHTAVLVGQGNKIEIWSKDNWDAYNAQQFTFERMYDAAEALGLAEVAAR